MTVDGESAPRSRSDRITVTIPAEIGDEVRRVAGDNVSKWVTEAIRARLAREQAIASLRQIGWAEPTPQARAWARQTLGLPTAGAERAS